MARNSAAAPALPAGAFPVARRRRPFEFWPDHPEGVTFGFLFRFLVAVLSVTFGTILLVIAGGIFTHWQLTWPLLVVFSFFIDGLIYIGEHFRSRVYERVAPDDKTTEIEVGETEVAEIYELALQKLRKEPVGLSPGARVAKRTFDLVFATMGLVILAPWLTLIAMAIKMDSRGPILFRQTRHGYNNATIKVFKFRSMALVEDDDQFVPAVRNYSRVTRVGALLRRTNMDELPQLINVLRGEMSIVGPRPHATAHNRMFGGKISMFSRRHGVKPGITGWAQVNGYRGAADTLEKMQRRVEHDLYYIDNWSFWLDLRIMAMTLFSKTAYTSAH
jgi:exopolysaccharide biosynthesis polyprenyl glycosylphosphotransferase